MYINPLKDTSNRLATVLLHTTGEKDIDSSREVKRVLMSLHCSEKKNSSGSCCCDGPSADTNTPLMGEPADGPKGRCCDLFPTDTGSTVKEKPGYRLLDFVSDLLPTKAGLVPVVRTTLNRQDKIGAVRVRSGIGRDRYRIAPGIYAVGKADGTSPVMVTANFKLSFDILRKHLCGRDAWILVVDTKSINVWCAAGKGTFSTEEVAKRVKETEIEKIVRHRKLILPQLAATGVSAHQVKKKCGFEVIWGPVHARDIKAFLDNGMKATSAMRQVTFSLKERVTLIPVELSNMWKPSLYLLPALFLISGLGKGFFSLNAAFHRGTSVLLAYLLALVAGGVLTPVFLPTLFVRTFAAKGAIVGAVAGAVFSALMAGRLVFIEMAALTLFIMTVSSYLSMNFTGSTPFTSPTGVEKEMRKAIPVQATSIVVAVVLWVGAGFMRV